MSRLKEKVKRLESQLRDKGFPDFVQKKFCRLTSEAATLQSIAFTAQAVEKVRTSLDPATTKKETAEHDFEALMKEFESADVSSALVHEAHALFEKQLNEAEASEIAKKLEAEFPNYNYASYHCSSLY
eukprot:scpid99887/ scgid14927/ 